MALDPHAVVTGLYESLSGPAHHARNWEHVHSFFLPGATLHSELVLPDGTHQSGTWTVDEFCEAAAEEYAKSGFWEQEVWSRMEEFGCIAHIWSTYESRIGDPHSAPAGRGINSFQLLHRDGEWRISALVFQIERGTEGIPARYLGLPGIP